MAEKYVYFFGNGKGEGNASMRSLLGGKGANLAEMVNLGIPVPAGFTISTKVCQLFYENNRKYPASIQKEIDYNVKKLEEAMGKKFGDAKNPLLVSVRSGAAASLPGMMDTVLNLGLNERAVKAIAEKTNNARFAWDSYRRFIQMFGNVVMSVDPEKFEHELESIKKKYKKNFDTELTVDHLKEVVKVYLRVAKKESGKEFPTEPKAQLKMAINAVFGSWNNDRAIYYRKMNNIVGLIGTAVNVQAMVFGNMGEDSATGVCFSRDPATGENKFYGEYLINAQGEDVVAGVRTPQEITLSGSRAWAKNNGITENKRKQAFPSLEEAMPKLYKQIVKIKNKLELHYKDMQDMEFTIESGKLYFLQTRSGKRTAAAAVKIAVDMAKENLISKQVALTRVESDQLDRLLHPTFDPKAKKVVIAKGLNASPGAAVGEAVFSADDACKKVGEGKRVILVRQETSPEDIQGMDVSDGILTARGGATSHAAVVARGMGKCCVAGCGGISIDDKKKEFRAGNIVIKEGDYISLDGSTGEVMKGKLPTVSPTLSGNFETLMKWADKTSRLKVRCNADTPRDCQIAKRFGAVGIGLCRTEHMFFEGDRIVAVREMILSDNEKERRKALKKLLPIQRKDFEGIFREMKGLPVTIRLLDPPLHEFLPHDAAGQKEVAKSLGITQNRVVEKMSALHEFNPMLGHRGCRLGISYPEVYEMQVRAIVEAACNVKKRGLSVYPEIMIPLVGMSEEFRLLKEKSEDIMQKVFKEKKVKVACLIGTMIEIPRAALTADHIAEEAEFFSFGTNDLTQMTLGFSRDDTVKVIEEYSNKGIFSKDPFQSLDQTGVGQLVETGIAKGRKSRRGLKVGICGEHGGDPDSIDFCHRVKMDYVSCSPYRVPIARLAAAQAKIRHN